VTVIDLLATNPLAFTISLGILGLFIGSFLNVVIHRFPIMLNREWKEAAREILADSDASDETIHLEDTEQEQEKYNLVVPRSACPKCGHQIKSYENIPVLSYLFLGGKCSGCKTPISMRYPLIELVTGLLFAACAATFGFSGATLATCLFVCLLVSLTFIDFDTKLLPDPLVYILLWLGLLVNMNAMFVPLSDAVVGALSGYLSLWGFYWIFKLATGKDGMGYGDFKLFAALGAWFGWQSLLLIIILASFVGALIGIVLMLFASKNRNSAIPFGPYLAMGGLIQLFYGAEILSYYFQTMGM